MISENCRIVPLFDPKNWTAGGTGTIIDISSARKVTIVFLTDTMAAVQQVLVRVGVAKNDVTTNLFAVGESVHIKRTNANIAAAGCDLLSNDVTLEASEQYWQLLATDHRMYVQEINGARLAGYRYMVASLPAATANNFVAGIAIIETRYSPAQSMAVVA